jgi:outer membrane protein insertion porin family
MEGVKENEETQMAALYQQNPNFRIPLTGIMPYLSLYTLGQQFHNPAQIQKRIQRTQERYATRITAAEGDASRVARLQDRREHRLDQLTLHQKDGNFLMRRLGEPPVIYDSLATITTVDQLSIYLEARGFFRNEVSYSKKVQKKKVFLTYHIREDQPFRYRDLSYQISDTAVHRLVLKSQAASHLVMNGRYDEETLAKERDRLETLLRNNGYFDFSKRYINFEVDTSYAPYSVLLTTIIANPPDAKRHIPYSIKNVYFIGDAGLNRFGRTRDTITFNQIHYLAYDHRFSPRILDKKITVYPGQPFSQERMVQTQRQLGDLDMFRFNNLSYTKIGGDSLAQQLDALVQVSPSPRYQETAEFGINMTERLPGPFANVRFRIRNLFEGSEVLELGIRGGYEGQFSRVEDRPVYTREFGGNAAIIFPRFLLPIVRDEYLAQFNPRTRINTGYTFINRPEYTRTNLETSLDYLWQKRRQVMYSVSPINVSIVNTPTIDSTFNALLIQFEQQGNPLRQSFNRSFISSMNFSRIYNGNNVNQTLNAHYLGTFVELGGLSQLLMNYRVGNLEMFQYARANIDFRRYYPLGNRNTFVYRAHAGIAAPLTFIGADSRALPYDKYFFSGGGSSLRAWRPRRLGPGSYSPPFLVAPNGESTGIRNYFQEQPGEILFEMNAEYRFHLFSYFNGALFLDAGNVWTLRNDRTRPGGQFTQDFYREIAVGTGFGLRMDFTFLILRLDVGAKVYDPAEPLGERLVIDQFKLRKMFGFGRDNQTAFNIGIGYPF